MPWKETTTMEQKVEFICEWLTQKYTITELCRVFEISRPTAYKMISRYENLGIEGLKEKRKSHLNQPDRTEETVEKNILELKGKYAIWEPKKSEGCCLTFVMKKTFQV